VRPRVLAVLAALFYLAVSFDHLSTFPKVGEDEPWIAAAPYKLATSGVYGDDLFAGYYGVEQRNYQQMPLYPLIEAAVFKAFGAGVAQMRALPVAFGFALLLLVFAAAARIADERVAALAVVLLVSLKVAAVQGATGIVLLDRARVNRYDVAVPVFGLIAFLLMSSRRFFLAGVAIGLASLSHLYGLFWFPALALVIAIDRGRRALRERPMWRMLGGFACAALPWAVYVATGWQDFRGQMLFVAARFDLLNPSFYADNLLHAQGPISVQWLRQTLPDVPWHRVGTWTTLVGIPTALVAMFRTRERGDASRNGPFAFAVIAVAQLAMFVLLLKVKTYSYMIALWPLGIICLAWLGVWMWDRSRRAVWRAALAALGLAIVAQGGIAVVRSHQEAARTTPYDFFEAEVARCIPGGSRVLGLQHYWLGLRQFEYRTWLMPLNMANPLYYDHPISLDRAIAFVKPDVILIDRYMSDMLAEAAPPAHPNHRYAAGLDAYLNAHAVEHACVIRDATYGRMEVLRIQGSGIREQGLGIRD